MADRDRSKQTEVHRLNHEKVPAGARATNAEKKKREASDAAKEASQTDDTIV
jgi:hypothetical protein